MIHRLTQYGLQSGRLIASCRAVVGAFGAVAVMCSMVFVPETQANHQGHQAHPETGTPPVAGEGREISVRRFASSRALATAGDSGLDVADLDAAVQTVVDALTIMVQHRADYPRFDESLAKQALKQAVIEPVVVNDEGKAFPFLVARTKEPGRVTLLISASALKAKGHLNHPDALIPILAREFQWVVSKADTAPKAKAVSVERELQTAPIRTDEEIAGLSAEERARLLQQLFDAYLRTVDDQKSLDGQPLYEVGSRTPIPPTHTDSTTKLYDIRIVGPAEDRA